MFSYHPFQESDLFEVMDIVRHELDYDYSPDVYHTIHDSWPDGTILVRYFNRIAGFIMAALVPGGGVRVLLLVVRREFQGRGVGSTLLGEIIRRAVSRGAPFITLEVRVENSKAIAFYQKFGFKITERKSNFYRDGGDAFIMKKPLNG